MAHLDHSDAGSARSGGPPGALDPDKLSLDLVQLTLDLVGVVEPTPFADGANALLSLARGDFTGAALSGAGMLPYLGDAAKAGRLPRYAQTVADSILLARRSPAFAAKLRPALTRVKGLIDTIPLSRLPEWALEPVRQIKRSLDEFLAPAGRHWWEVLPDPGPPIVGSSVPQWLRMRVGDTVFQIKRNAHKPDAAGNPIGPSTKHLGEIAARNLGKTSESGQVHSAWSRLYQVDFPMTALAGLLDEAEFLIKAGRRPSDGFYRVDGWKLRVNTTTDPWRVYHLSPDR